MYHKYHWDQVVLFSAPRITGVAIQVDLLIVCSSEPRSVLSRIQVQQNGRKICELKLSC